MRDQSATHDSIFGIHWIWWSRIASLYSSRFVFVLLASADFLALAPPDDGFFLTGSEMMYLNLVDSYKLHAHNTIHVFFQKIWMTISNRWKESSTHTEMQD